MICNLKVPTSIFKLKPFKNNIIPYEENIKIPFLKLLK